MINISKLPPIARLNELYLIDAESKSGLTRKINSTWGRHLAGASVGAKSCGYWRTKVDGHGYQVHRLIWTMAYGMIPKGMEIDHINGDPGDNRLENLRLVTHGQNSRNKKRYGGSASKYVGVSWYAADQRWKAQIKRTDPLTSEQTTKHIGYFRCETAAALARDREVIRRRDPYPKLNILDYP